MSKDADAFDNRFKILLTGDRCIAIIPATRLPCSVPRLRGACRVVVSHTQAATRSSLWGAVRRTGKEQGTKTMAATRRPCEEAYFRAVRSSGAGGASWVAGSVAVARHCAHRVGLVPVSAFVQRVPVWRCWLLKVGGRTWMVGEGSRELSSGRWLLLRDAAWRCRLPLQLLRCALRCCQRSIIPRKPNKSQRCYGAQIRTAKQRHTHAQKALVAAP